MYKYENIFTEIHLKTLLHISCPCKDLIEKNDFLKNTAGNICIIQIPFRKTKQKPAFVKVSLT